MIKLSHWQIDRIDTALPFSKRLARENGWTHAYAKSVTEEYKKFIFLAIHAGHPVTPSDAIDQAWHLHLTYTKSYWEELCDNILGQKLHHNPTKGGKQEDAKFEDWYSKTLISYQRFFGTLPPAHIWPAALQRFEETRYFKRINTHKVWIVPKPGLSIRALSILLIASLSAIVIGCSGDPVATGLIVGFGAIALLIFIIIRLTLRVPKTSPGTQKHNNRRNSRQSTTSNSSDSSSNDFSGSSNTASAAGFAGFGGGLFGGGGAGGDYSDSTSNDSGSDGGSSGCGGGCGGGD